MAETPGIARAVFRAMIPAWSAMGFTVNGMLIRARELGFGVRRQWAQTAYRSVTGLIKGEYAARSVTRDQTYPQNKMVETELARAYKYRVHGWATYFNESTGQEERRRVSMYTDSWLGLDAWGGEFRGEFTEFYFESGEILVSTDFKVVEHNTRMSY